ncbi:histidine kinase [Kordia algicida OT-1]|uniref:DEAD/DEAH box helicase-like protein n=1 Tax=Kordia algicida OT-1 TaxID=391587 RepID=A9DKT6_9FLAO|nr:histidine kinase [Kordia algicida]EDP98398.1 DEAD/DEAH box helicase-like protein [Kordia algicida OT-1]
MAASKKVNTILFWIFQFIGWGFLTTANVWSKAFIVPEDKVKPVYFFFEGLIFIILGIGLTTFFRNYLKRIEFIENQTQKNYIRAIIAFLVLSLIFSFTLVFLSSLIFASVNGKPLEFSILLIVSNTINVALFLFFWSLIYITIKSVVRMQRVKMDRLRLQTSLKESQLNTLKGQLNPHFMFNSLNNIRGLMLEDVEKSREMLTRLSEMLRYSLNMNNVDAIQIAQELETVENYIALSKIQLEDRLQYEQKVNESLLQIKIPPMILQMLVENAIKHGIATQKNGGKITVIVTDNNEEIILQVNNTGNLKTDSNSTKIGVHNIKKRLELLYGEKATFTLDETENEVQAIIKIPVN